MVKWILTKRVDNCLSTEKHWKRKETVLRTGDGIDDKQQHKSVDNNDNGQIIYTNNRTNQRVQARTLVIVSHHTGLTTNHHCSCQSCDSTHVITLSTRRLRIVPDEVGLRLNERPQKSVPASCRSGGPGPLIRRAEPTKPPGRLCERTTGKFESPLPTTPLKLGRLSRSAAFCGSARPGSAARDRTDRRARDQPLLRPCNGTYDNRTGLN